MSNVITSDSFLKKIRFLTYTVRMQTLALIRMSDHGLQTSELSEYLHKPMEYLSEHLTDIRRVTGIIKRVNILHVFPSYRRWWVLNEDCDLYTPMVAIVDAYIKKTNEAHASYNEMYK